MGIYTLMALMGSFFTVWMVVAWVACGFISGHLAGEKGRCGFCWFCIGALFGPIGLIGAAGLPDDRKTKTIHDPDAEAGGNWITRRIDGPPAKASAGAVIAAIVLFGIVYAVATQ